MRILRLWHLLLHNQMYHHLNVLLRHHKQTIMLSHSHLDLQVKDKDVTIKRLVVVVVVVTRKQVKHNQAKAKHKVVVDKDVEDSHVKEGTHKLPVNNNNSNHLVTIKPHESHVNLVNLDLLGKPPIITKLSL